MSLEPDERSPKAPDARDEDPHEPDLHEPDPHEPDPHEPDPHRPDQYLDASGLDCPLPLLKAKQALAGMRDGEVLEVIATDAGSWRDFESFVAHSSHQLLEREAEGGRYRYRLRKVSKDAAR